jgi:hypothetical protein
MERSIPGIRMVTETLQDTPTRPRLSAVTLFAGDRSRPGLEDSARNAYDIERRDLRKTLRVFVKQRRYQEIPIFDLLSAQERAAFIRSGRHWNARREARERPASGNSRILIRYEQVPTDEMMFGCTAYKWLITHREEKTQANSVNFTERVTDAWYLDVDQAIRRYPGFSPRLTRRGLCYLTVNGEAPIIETSGEPPQGLCVQSTTRATSRLQLPTGEIREQLHVQSFNTLSLIEERFSESIFEPPPGFRRMPVYPSWFTMARLDAMRNFKLLGARVGSTFFRRTA